MSSDSSLSKGSLILDPLCCFVPHLQGPPWFVSVKDSRGRGRRRGEAVQCSMIRREGQGEGQRDPKPEPGQGGVATCDSRLANRLHLKSGRREPHLWLCSRLFFSFPFLGFSFLSSVSLSPHFTSLVTRRPSSFSFPFLS